MCVFYPNVPDKQPMFSGMTNVTIDLLILHRMFKDSSTFSCTISAISVVMYGVYYLFLLATVARFSGLGHHRGPGGAV